ncbi:MAG: DUF1343 domain-containing protein [Bacillota bacterium]
MVLTGIDVVLGDDRAAQSLVGKRMGIITNPTGVNRCLKTTLELMQRDRRFRVVAAFSPEHGLQGEVQDAVGVGEYRDEATGLPVYSLYGMSRQPTAEMLAGIDALVFDIQDVGVRFYTYISTMLLSMRACKKHGKEFIVLDRPNPISGSVVEGNILDRRFASFLGPCPIPIRHGLTVGELATWANDRLAIGCNLTVCEMRGWTRSMWADETGLPWVMPSPNLPTLDTAAVYPGTCFVEGINVSEGRGTTRPFELMGAPWINAKVLSEHLNAKGLPGCRFRSVHFVPTFSKYAGQTCGGVQVHVVDRTSYESVHSGAHIIAAIRRLWPEHFRWVETPELSSEGKFHIDLLAGTDELRLAIDGDKDIDCLLDRWDQEAASFARDRERFLFYG